MDAGRQSDSSTTADVVTGIDVSTADVKLDVVADVKLDVVADVKLDVGADAAEASTDAGADADAANILCGAIDTSFGTAVALQNATATFSQSVFGNFSVTKVIDGIVGDGLGWAIVNSGVAVAQTAAFETTTDTPAFANGSRFVFVLDQTFATEHALGRFRLSVTTSARTVFADGNDGTADAGDVGTSGIWTVLTPTRQCATTGATLTKQGDNSLVAQDLDSTNAIYVVEADSALVGVTGIRLEALQDAALPMTGPGLQNANGNFVLTEMKVRVGAK